MVTCVMLGVCSERDALPASGVGGMLCDAHSRAVSRSAGKGIRMRKSCKSRTCAPCCGGVRKA